MNKLYSILLPFFYPDRSIPLFILGTLTLTLSADVIFAWGSIWVAGAAIVLSVAIIVIRLFIMRPRPIYVRISDERKPKKQFALILLVSPHKAASEDIINYHLPELHNCWLIATQASLGIASELEKTFEGKVARIYAGKDYLVDETDLKSTFGLIDRIINKELLTLDPRPPRIMLDITGGTKVMTAGMVLAGFANQVLMEYTQTVRDTNGEVKPGAVPQPTLIEAYFQHRTE